MIIFRGGKWRFTVAVKIIIYLPHFYIYNIYIMKKVKDLEAKIKALEKEVEKWKQIVFTYPVKNYRITCRVIEEYETDIITATLKEAKEIAKNFELDDVKTDWELTKKKISFNHRKKQPDISGNV